MHVYSNGPSENGIIGLEKGIRLGVNTPTRTIIQGPVANVPIFHTRGRAVTH